MSDSKSVWRSLVDLARHFVPGHATPPHDGQLHPAPVSVETIPNFYSHALNNHRNVDVFLPPEYHHGHRRYPVLYINDGQDMEAWRLRTTLERMYAEHGLPHLIAVAMHANERMQEYGIAGHPNSYGLGSRAEAYSRFVVDELMPQIESRFRTQRGPNHTAVMGASLGGLMAFDLAWRHAERFGAVGVFSGSFWWRSEDGSVEAMQRSRLMHKVVRETRSRPRVRMWFEAGLYDEESDRDGNGVIDAIQDTTELMDELRHKGYNDHDMTYVEVAGDHSPNTWAIILPEFLTWAFR